MASTIKKYHRRFSQISEHIKRRDRKKQNVYIMDCMFEACLEATQEPDDIPKTLEPVWILGKKYNAIQDLNKIRQDIVSKLWLTYRKNFVPIGGDGLTSDKGWGCMLRCGQMVLANALVCLHLGRDWLWDPQTRDPTYLKILKKFQERRQAPYSIHQIALMGASLGKTVGQWFGPNTVAQVLKKLVRYDEWSRLAIHVALDNTIVINDIKELCLSQTKLDGTNLARSEWKPLLLIVPLRLGLTDINPIYVSGLQKCFQFKQSLGVIGGKPNVALYFIGCVGKEVIYLDPHNTQKTGFVENKETEEQIELDLTYHCKYASRINMLKMDPSVAVCFFCKTEADFNDLCQRVKTDLIDPEKEPMFEVSYSRPKEWSPTLENAIDAGSASFAEFQSSGRSYDSEHEFELI